MHGLMPRGDHWTLHVSRTCTTCCYDVYSFIRQSYGGPPCARSSKFTVLSCLSYIRIGAHRFPARYTPATRVKKLGVWSHRLGEQQVRQMCSVREEKHGFVVSTRMPYDRGRWGTKSCTAGIDSRVNALWWKCRRSSSGPSSSCRWWTSLLLR